MRNCESCGQLHEGVEELCSTCSPIAVEVAAEPKPKPKPESEVGETFSVTMKSGETKSVYSTFTDFEISQMILNAQNPTDFAHDLASRASNGQNLSEKQRAWLHVMGMEFAIPKKRFDVDCTPIVKLLKRAQETQKRCPKIHLPGMCISLRRNHTVRIDNGGTFGTPQWRFLFDITEEGELRPSVSLPDAEADALAKRLAEFVANPAKVAGQIGVATGNCCFCALPLSTPESLTVGYGPICAEKYGLPWGDVIETAAARAGRLQAEVNELQAVLEPVAAEAKAEAPKAPAVKADRQLTELAPHLQAYIGGLQRETDVSARAAICSALIKIFPDLIWKPGSVEVR